MTIWLLVVFFILANAMALLWGGALLWAYYRGTKQADPIPNLTIPRASLFGKKPTENGEHEQDVIPASVRRA